MPTPDEILTLGVELDAKNALRQMQRLQAQMKGELRHVTKAVDAFGKLNKKAWGDAVDGTRDYLTELDDVSLAHSKQLHQLGKLGDQIEALEKKQEKATGTTKTAIEEQIALLKKQGSTLADRVALKLVTTASSNKMRKDMSDTFEKVVDDAGSIFGSFFGKDLKGMIEGGTKGAGKLLGFGLTKAAAGAFKKSVQLRDAGTGLAERGAARGGVGGAAMSGMGAALKGMGGLMNKIGPILSSLSKLGPILSTVSGIVVGLVKLFIDAEAQVKQFNQDILASASTAEFLGQKGTSAALAFDDLDNTLKSIRDHAHDVNQNLAWGITAEEHGKVLNVLTQEGITLQSMGEQAKRAGKEVGAFTAELTHVSLAYSRAFGVPLQEINQMQAEMMTDLGQSLDQTKLSFTQMTRSATESGMASNKFFAIIRGVSADLSLYNTRMEDAVKTLKLLGKVMNPREAAKFMNTATQGLKNMGRQERLRMTLLTGAGKMGKLVDRDMKRKADGLAETLAKTSGKTAAEISKMIQEKGGGAVMDLVDTLPKEAQGATREALIELDIQKSRASKGTFGVSGAAGGLGPAASLQAMQASLLRLGGGKTLKEGAGSLPVEMLADNLGVSEEQLNQMIKFEAAIDMERDALKKGLADNNPEVIARLQKAGLKSASDIDAAGYDQIYDAMSESTKTMADETAKVENYAKKQTDLTSSLLKKLDTVIQWLMNEFYNVILNIYEAILSLPGMGGDEKKKGVELLRAARASKDTDMQDAAQKAANVAGGGILTPTVRANDVMEKSLKESEGGQKILDALGANTGGDKARTAARLGLMKKVVAVGGGSGLYDAAKNSNAGVSKEFTQNLERILGKKKVEEDLAFQKSQGRRVTDSDYASANAEVEKRAQKGELSTYSMQALTKMNPKDVFDLIRQASDGTSTKVQDLTAITKSMAGSTAFTDKSQEQSYIDAFKELKEDAGKVMAEKATKEMSDALTTPHTAYFKFSKSFLRGDYQTTMEEVMLESLRKALFEYYMYSKLDPKDVAKFIGEEGMTIPDFAEKVGQEAEEGRTPKDFTALDYVTTDANASGGVVASVNGGLATVRAAAGEGLASVGPGERILPAGARSGGNWNGNIVVNGLGGEDLARFLHVKVVDGIAEYKRKERYR